MNNQTYSYTAYGLNIETALRLPELGTAEEEDSTRRDTVKLVVRFGEVKDAPAQEPNATRHFYATPEGICLFWRGVGAFLVHSGCEITIDPAPGVEARVLRNLFLGPALGVALFQRGLLVFHASVVSFSSGAVAFLALKGYGKSTMAAALHVRGQEILADDIMALDTGGGRMMVRPGVPRLKLWPDALQAIGDNPESHALLLPDYDKRARRVSNGFGQSPVPLRCVYVLGVGPQIDFARLRPKDALLYVLPHWYGALFDGDLLKIFGLGNHFRQCTYLVQNVPVFLLKRPASLMALPDVAQAVEKHLASDVCRNRAAAALSPM